MLQRVPLHQGAKLALDCAPFYFAFIHRHGAPPVLR